MRAVNLLPKDAQPHTGWRSVRVFERVAGGRTLLVLAAALLAAAALAYVTVSFLGASGAVRERQQTLDKLDTELATARQRLPSTPAVEPALVGERAQRIGALNSALTRRVAWDRMLRQLSLVIPSDVWLTSLDAVTPQAPGAQGTAPTPSAPGTSAACGAPGTVCLSGYAYAQEGVARLLGRLAIVPSFENVLLQSSTRVTLGTRAVFQFAVRADIDQPAAGS
jgi:Tfp pilus assembly protein PilN